MGYSAVAEGMIFLDKTERKMAGIAAEFIRSSIAEYAEICKAGDEEICVTFCSGSQEYDEAVCRDLYAMVSHGCTGGHIDFRGEDGALWCHHYHEDTGEWKEHRGRIVYEGLGG